MKALKFQFQLLHVPCFLNITAFASGFGTKEEAATLLERGIALVRIDKNRTLDLFTTGEEIIQKGLYVFRAAPDGSVTAHPSEGGTPGEDLAFDNAKTRQFFETTYKFRKPNTDSDKKYTKLLCSLKFPTKFVGPANTICHSTMKKRCSVEKRGPVSMSPFS